METYEISSKVSPDDQLVVVGCFVNKKADRRIFVCYG